MDALIKQLVEALVLSRLALDHVDAGPLNTVEIARAKEMAEAAIQAAIQYELGRTLPSESEGKQDSQSIESDLQDVSLKMDGAIFGGRYRVLPDGQMELHALGYVHREIRHESTPHEQARAMLADYINLQIYREARPGTRDERA